MSSNVFEKYREAPSIIIICQHVLKNTHDKDIILDVFVTSNSDTYFALIIATLYKYISYQEQTCI